MKKEDIFDPAFIEEIGFRLVKDDGQYGEAKDIRGNGITVLNWNREGHSCTYFGDALEPNAALSIKKDGGTRRAFSGYIYNREQIKLLLSLTA